MKRAFNFLPILIAVGLAGCGSPDAEERSAGAPESGSVAQSSPDAPGPPAANNALAAAAESYAAGETPLTLVDSDDSPPRRVFDVIDCGEEGRAIDPSEAGVRPEEKIARRVALLRRSLRLVGYSAAVIDQPLADYADKAARSPDADHYADLAAALDEHREDLQPTLPPIQAVGGCGAGEVPILVKSRPAGGRVWLITKFAFDLCRARRVDAWDRTACDRWSEVAPDRAVELSGNYVYQAEWPGGRRARGNRRIDPVEDEDDNTKPQIITVDQS